jgi:hypothetical protein
MFACEFMGYHRFRQDATWFFQTIGAISKGKWIPSRWLMDQLLASSWYAFAEPLGLCNACSTPSLNSLTHSDLNTICRLAMDKDILDFHLHRLRSTIIQEAMCTEEEMWDDWDPEERAEVFASLPPSDLVNFPTLDPPDSLPPPQLIHSPPNDPSDRTKRRRTSSR